MLEYCTENQMMLGEAKSLIFFITKLEVRNPASFCPVSDQFRTPDAFVSYLDRARKWKVREEVWRGVSIETSFGVNRTGVFRPVLELMVQQLLRAGGTDSIVPFAEAERFGKRASRPLTTQMQCGTITNSTKWEAIW